MKAKDFKNKKITIIGLGLHGGGVGSAKFFSELEAKVLVTDLKSKEELKESIAKLKDYPIKYVLGQHRPEDFINTDLVIKNPAIPENSRYLQIAKENKVPIDTDIGIFFELCPAKIIGVTGTKGKSTTSALIARFLKRKYSNTFLAGNIRKSALEILDSIDKNSFVVLELSSWQLAGLRPHKKSPQCSVITNILPDHLNKYKNMESYISDKREIFKWQKSKDSLILNFDDKIVRQMADKTKKPKIFYYTKENEFSNAASARKEKIYFNEKEICSFDDIKLKGGHNISNILAAVSVAKLYNISDKDIKQVLGKFQGLNGRLEEIDTIEKVKYINDTTATIPDATLAALSSFPPKKNIILIAGGSDKKLNFEKLALMIVKKVKTLILLDGSATHNLENLDKDLETIGPFNNMKQAVFEAKDRASENDIVLLSPACASFGLFKHEFERGEQFNQAVKLLREQ
ncbi:UDP-N-acetylmuramoyl-L-alanine--D-glutamate ligase [Patescibacteria group bacterium]